MTDLPAIEREPLSVHWDGSGTARVDAIDEATIVVRSTRAFAPGSRPSGSLGTGDTLRMKTHRCRREDRADGFEFTIDGRPLDMPRELRARLEALVG